MSDQKTVTTRNEVLEEAALQCEAQAEYHRKIYESGGGSQSFHFLHQSLDLATRIRDLKDPIHD